MRRHVGAAPRAARMTAADRSTNRSREDHRMSEAPRRTRAAGGRPAARADRQRRDRHGRRGLHRHAGALAGQADPRAVLPRLGARARHRGLQLPARRRRRHEHRRRLRDELVGARLRRHDVRPRPGDPAAAAVGARRGDGAVRPVLARRQRPGHAVAAAGAGPPGRPGRRPGLAGAGRHRAGVHRLRRHLRAGLDQGLPRPDAEQPVQRRLLDPRHDAGRAAAARHPQRHVRRRPGRRERQGRVQPRASTRSPSSTTT